MRPQRLIMYPGFMSASDPHEFKKTLGVTLVYRDRAYRPQPGDCIIGWGNSREPIWAQGVIDYKIPVLNKWTSIRNAVSKDTALEKMVVANVATVETTKDRDTAKFWLQAGHTVMARTELRGMKGAGIVVMKGPRDFVDAPLYTKFKTNCDEYRVHVAFGKVINFQQKKRKNGVDCCPYVRSEENGWVFARKNVTLPKQVERESVKAVASLGLDFGAVDCLFSTIEHLPYVLEVNTAPGLDYEYGIEAYTQAFQEKIASL